MRNAEFLPDRAKVFVLVVPGTDVLRGERIFFEPGSGIGRNLHLTRFALFRDLRGEVQSSV